MTAATETDTRFYLLCLAGSVQCALPLSDVVEVMRPPPAEALAGAPSFVSGVAVVRGAPLLVVVLQRLFGGDERPPDRLVVARSGSRRVGLAVNGIVGVRALSRQLLADLPPLLEHGSPAITEIATLDNALLLLLDAARIVPDDVFARLEGRAMAS
jgi:purine-binding chemotaxis protein CheW